MMFGRPFKDKKATDVYGRLDASLRKQSENRVWFEISGGAFWTLCTAASEWISIVTILVPPDVSCS